ncbi:MAG: hypothetical protein ACRYGP_02630 [Janthinobacterium lividum]
MGSTMARILIGMAWAALLALTLVWWLPSILLTLAVLWGGRVRFGLVMDFGRALVAIGRSEAASRLYVAEIERCERRRHGWRR